MMVKPEVILSGENEIMAYNMVSGSRSDGRNYENYQIKSYLLQHGTRCNFTFSFHN